MNLPSQTRYKRLTGLLHLSEMLSMLKYKLTSWGPTSFISTLIPFPDKSSGVSNGFHKDCGIRHFATKINCTFSLISVF